MNKKKEEDLFMGQLNEDYIKDVICSHFNLQHLNKLDIFNTMDFQCDNNYFEIKSRNCNHNKYDTTMIGYNKINFAKRFPQYNCYFVFVFTDGDYYYKYNPEDKFETGIGGRNDRGKAEYKKYCYIPIDKLTKF